MSLNFIKKYSEILCLGGFLLYWLWDTKISPFTINLSSSEWASLANASASLVLASIGIWGVNSWKGEYKQKEQYKAAVNFGEHAKNSVDALRHIASNFYLPHEIPSDMSNSVDRHSEIIIHILNSYMTTFSKLYTYLNRSQIVLGDDASSIYNKIHQSIHDIKEHCSNHYDIGENIKMVRAQANIHAPGISLEAKQQSSYALIRELEDKKRLLRKNFFKELKEEIAIIQNLIDKLLAENTI
ncbi:hypothetical protein [Halodesulfovibrio sp.]|jgi:hypothetical protein|uniref:hypothetical protein n=1 Tax=Halodesulfovibrio sp. TaxID=1912772 RepID=UPI0025FFD4B9|nr:hypothetical protein [Halodesulfovibrio sp.]MCT4627959.1 hypothetical protein [Halodesulfovibrio sp.]